MSNIRGNSHPKLYLDSSCCAVALLQYSFAVGRCYETAALYYRLNKGQIFTMEDVTYVNDRESFAESAFYLTGVGYVELDQFIDHCFSDPSFCTAGLSLSLYVKVQSVSDESQTLIR